MRLNRRQLLQSAAFATAAGAVETKAAATDRIGVGLVGCGGMGLMDLADFQKQPEVEIVAVCDVDEVRRAQGLKQAGGRAQAYSDYRRLLEDQRVNAVIVATPDHWHPLIAVDACDAGKDVYVEKPVSTRVLEGRAMVKAARRNSRVVQVGLQQRSGSHFQRAAKLVRDGELGEIHYVQCWMHEREQKEGMGNPPDSLPPANLDWDFWLGPAEKIPYNKNYHPGSWRVFYPFGGGHLTDWGVHLVDVVHMAMGVDRPVSVSASGGKLYVTDNRDTPDTMEVTWEYPGFLLHYSHMYHNAHGQNGDAGNRPFGSYGIQFHGTRGTLFIDRNGYEVTPQMTQRKEPGGIAFRAAFDDLAGVSMYYELDGIAARGTTSVQHLPHVQNFVKCMKTRERPTADIEIGHRTTTACHLGNIAYHVRRSLRWDAEQERFLNDNEANAWLTRNYRAPWKLNGL